MVQTKVFWPTVKLLTAVAGEFGNIMAEVPVTTDQTPEPIEAVLAVKAPDEAQLF